MANSPRGEQSSPLFPVSLRARNLDTLEIAYSKTHPQWVSNFLLVSIFNLSSWGRSWDHLLTWWVKWLEQFNTSISCNFLPEYQTPSSYFCGVSKLGNANICKNDVWRWAIAARTFWLLWPSLTLFLRFAGENMPKPNCTCWLRGFPGNNPPERTVKWVDYPFSVQIIIKYPIKIPINHNSPSFFCKFSPFSHGFPMVFPWFSHGFPNVLAGRGHQSDSSRGLRWLQRTLWGAALDRWLWGGKELDVFKSGIVAIHWISHIYIYYNINK